MNQMPLKSDVLAAVESERAYQKSKHGTKKRTVGEMILIMEKVLRDARHAWYSAGDAAALHEIRQVAAVAFAAMEEFGAPKRGEAGKPRARNLPFDALCEMTGYDPNTLTENQRGRIAKTIKQLKEVTPVADDVLADMIRVQWPRMVKNLPPDSKPTPMALTNHWKATETSAKPSGSVPPSAFAEADALLNES